MPQKRKTFAGCPWPGEERASRRAAPPPRRRRSGREELKDEVVASRARLLYEFEEFRRRVGQQEHALREELQCQTVNACAWAKQVNEYSLAVDALRAEVAKRDARIAELERPLSCTRLRTGT